MKGGDSPQLIETQTAGKTYRDHGEQNEAGGRCFLGTIVGIDESVDRRGGEDQATAEISNNRNVVCLYAIRGDDDKNT